MNVCKVEIDLNVPVTCRQLGSVIVTTNEQEGILVILVNLYHTALKSDFINANSYFCKSLHITSPYLL